MQSNSKKLFLSPKPAACWIWHSSQLVPLPRCHRASPLTSLDKKYYSVKNKKPLLEKRRGQIEKIIGPLLIYQVALAGFGTVPNWIRCRGVIGPVPQPLWIRSIFTLFIF